MCKTVLPSRVFIAGASAILLTVIAFVGVHEYLWRFDHRLLQLGVVSPGGKWIAEARTLPEASPAPYGTGVFIRSRRSLLVGEQSMQVLTGYCESLAIAWIADDRLGIECDYQEHAPKSYLPPRNGISVEVKSHPLPSR